MASLLRKWSSLSHMISHRFWYIMQIWSPTRDCRNSPGLLRLNCRSIYPVIAIRHQRLHRRFRTLFIPSATNYVSFNFYDYSISLFLTLFDYKWFLRERVRQTAFSAACRIFLPPVWYFYALWCEIIWPFRKLFVVLAGKVTTKKWNAERYSDRIELQGFWLKWR